MYSPYGYGSAIGPIIWGVLALVLAIIGGILVFILFLNSKRDLKLTGFIKWLKDFLEFKVMIVETILKVVYLISTIYIILFSFTFIATSFLTFILCLIIGPLVIRLIFEGTLMFIMIWKNTNEINKKTK